MSARGFRGCLLCKRKMSVRQVSWSEVMQAWFCKAIHECDAERVRRAEGVP